MAGAGDVTAGTAEVVPSYIWINNDCGGIEEFTETAVLSAAYSQGLALLCAEDAPPKDGRRSQNFTRLGRKLIAGTRWRPEVFLDRAPKVTLKHYVRSFYPPGLLVLRSCECARARNTVDSRT